MEFQRDPEKYLEDGICPFCGGEMEFGFVYSSHWISWTKEEPRFIGQYSEILDSSFWPFAKLRAGKCTNCEAIVIPKSSREPTMLEEITGTWIKCPRCGAGYFYNLDEVEGSQLLCQNCAKEFNVPSEKRVEETE